MNRRQIVLFAVGFLLLESCDVFLSKYEDGNIEDSGYDDASGAVDDDGDPDGGETDGGGGSNGERGQAGTDGGVDTGGRDNGVDAGNTDSGMDGGLDVVTNRCNGITCSDHGTCNPDNGRCDCDYVDMTEDCSSCKSGFIGYPNCVDDPCDPDPCNDYGECDSDDGTCTCEEENMTDDCGSCESGFIGYPNCVDDPCDPDPCNGQGNCDQSDGSCCIRYVDIESPSAVPDGTSWDLAFKKVQEGIDAAREEVTTKPGLNTCQVWVSEGVYYIYEFGPTDTVLLEPGVPLFGGFSGDETQLDESDYKANLTILDGHDGPSGANQVYHVVTGCDEALIDGFTITGGNAYHPLEDSEHRNGGGIYNVGTSLTVANCTVRGNLAQERGGGMYNNGASVEMINCVISNNSAQYRGGGIYNENNNSEVTNCVFSYNEEGGMYNENASPTIKDCMFVGNVDSGGLYNHDNSSPTVEDTIFIGNSSHNGGGMSNGQQSSPTITDCIFSANSSVQDGGGIYNGSNSSPTITRSIFAGNRMDGSSSGYGGGAIHNDGDSAPTITNCIFAGNSVFASTKGGGGIYNLYSSPTITNCTFVGNAAGEGGGLYNYESSSPIVTNCIVWGNSPSSIESLSYSTPDINFSDIQGGYPGTANTNEDPMFAGYPLFGDNWETVSYDPSTYKTSLIDDDQLMATGALKGLFTRPDMGDVRWFPIADNDEHTIIIWGDLTDFVAIGDTYEVYDLRLSGDSPCIDAAEGNLAPEFDFDGNSRVNDPNTPNTGYPTDNDFADMGVFEYQP